MNTKQMMIELLALKERQNPSKLENLGELTVFDDSNAPFKQISTNLIRMIEHIYEERGLLSFTIDGDEGSVYYAEQTLADSSIVSKMYKNNDDKYVIEAVQIAHHNGNQTPVQLLRKSKAQSVLPIVAMLFQRTDDEIEYGDKLEDLEMDLKYLFHSIFQQTQIQSIIDGDFNSLAMIRNLDFDGLEKLLQQMTNSTYELFTKNDDIVFADFLNDSKEFPLLNIKDLPTVSNIGLEKNKEKYDVYIKQDNTRLQDQPIYLYKDSTVDNSAKELESLEDYRDAFKLCEFEELSKDQQANYRLVEDQMVDISIPKQLKEIASLVSFDFKKINPNKKNIRQLLFSGEPGGGKSFTTKILAYVLGLPHHQSVESDEKIYASDFFATLVPNVENEFDDVLDDHGVIDIESYVNQSTTIPSIDEVLLMPAMAYTALTGKNAPNNVSSGEVLQLRDQKMQNAFSKAHNELVSRGVSPKDAKNSDEKEFVMVYTELGRVAVNGGVIDLQEIDMTKDQTSLSFLYEFLEEGWVTLPNGEKFQRHENTLVVVTINGQTGGFVNKPLPTAFLDRFPNKYYFDSMTHHDMASRMYDEYNGQLEFETLVNMAKLVLQVQEIIKDDGLEGFVGYRSYKNWVDTAYVSEDLYNSCISTVINKITDEEEERTEIKTNVLDNSQFAISEGIRLKRENID